MKRIFVLLLSFALLLAGCSTKEDVDRAMALRQKVLACSGCSFDVEITADYGDKLYTFAMQCSADASGKLMFTVTAPETIAGISGQISAEEGQLHFDDRILTFELLTEDLVTPVSAPWLLLRTLRGGYISAGGKDGDLFQFQIDDSYEDDPLRLDVWLDDNNIPVRADIIWDGRRVVSLSVENFVLL